MPTYLVGPTRPYTTIQAAVNAAVTGFGASSGVSRIIIDAGTYTESVSVLYVGSPTKYIQLEAASGSEHRGNINSGVIIQNPAFPSHTVNVDGYTRIYNIVIKNTNNFGFNNSFSCLGYSFFGHFENLIFVKTGFGHGCSTQSGHTNTQNPTVFYKCLAISFSSELTQRHNGFSNKTLQDGVVGSGHNTLLINCGSFNFNACYNFGGINTGKIVNCWGARAVSSVGHSSVFSGSYNEAESTNNASNENPIPGSNDLSITVNQMAFVNSGSNNFHILSTSLLFGAGVEQGLVFSEDWDLETIGIWCIGPDCFAASHYLPTSADPYKGPSLIHEPKKDASDSGYRSVRSEASPALKSSGRKLRDARDKPSKMSFGPGSPSLKASSDVKDAQIVHRVSKKPYKTGFISVIPEAGGYGGGQVLGTGNKIPFFDESLTSNKVFSEQFHAGKKRVESTRGTLPSEPSGGFIAPLRSNDLIPTLMSHFQNRIGTTPAVGTTYYEFTPLRSIRTGGAGFGTGSYGGTTANAFTVSLFKAVEGTGYHFQSGVCDDFGLYVTSTDEASVTPRFFFSKVDLVATSVMSKLGDFSTLDSYPGWKANINFLDLPITSFGIISKNNLKRITPAGTDSRFYKFTRFTVEGMVAVDVPKTALAYIGSMLAGSSFPVYGTLYNSETDKVIFQMPNCRMDNFALGLQENKHTIKFKAYESEDGGEPPIKYMLWTTGYSATTFQPN